MKGFKDSRLAIQISSTILAIVVFITTLLLFYNYTSAKKILLKDSREKSQATLELAIERLDARFNEIETTLNANDFFFDKNVSKLSINQINLFQEKLLNKNEYYYGTALAFTNKNDAPYKYKFDKKIVHKNLNTTTYNYKIQNWFLQPLKSNKSLWIDPYFDHGGGETFLSTYVIPIKKGDTPTAILTIDVTLEWLEKIISSIKIYKSGYAFLLNSEGSFIVHPNKDLVNKENLRSLAKKLNQPYLIEIAEDIKNKKSGYRKVLPFTTNKTAWLYYAPLKNTDWTLALIFPEEELYRDLHKLNHQLILIGAIGLTLLLILIVVIVNQTIRPLNYLAKATGLISQGDFNTPMPKVTQKNEIGELTQAFEKMRQELKTTIKTTIELEKEKNKIEHELNIAQDIQSSILTKLFPPFPNIKSFDIYAVVKPAKEVGGDLFDFSIQNGNKLFFAVGDVSGKGVPSSLYMAITLTLFRALQHPSPKQTLVKMNNELSSNNSSMMFITFLMGVLDLETGEVTLCNAGHNPPYILRQNGTIEQLQLHNSLPLGIMPDIEYDEDKYVLNSGDSIFLYSDGVTEAQNSQLEQYGTGRLLEELKNCLGFPPKSVTNKIIHSLGLFTQNTPPSDDITIEVVSFYGEKGAPHQKIQTASFKSEISELSNITNFIHSFATKNALHPDAIFKINLAVDELFTNTVFHSAKGPGSSEIKLSLSLNANEVRIILEDQGPAFDPTLVPPPQQDLSLEEMKIGGLGIHIVKELMSEISYRRMNETNVLIMSLII